MGRSRCVGGGCSEKARDISGKKPWVFDASFGGLLPDVEMLQVGWIYDEDIMDLLKRMIGKLIREIRFTDQAQVDAAFLQLPDGGHGGMAGDEQLDVWVLHDEIGQIGEQNVPAEGCGGTDPELTNPKHIDLLQLFLRRADVGKGFPEMIVEKLSVLRQGNAPGGTVDQAYRQSILQIPYGLTHGGLGNVKLLGSPADASGFCDR